MKRLAAKKSIQEIQKEAQSGASLKRVLGPWNLVSLGIGAIIGAGIFVLTGNAAANHAGPAIVLSFVLAGVACAFAGLCYAELASLLPISGSAYTYAYATLGEFIAWIIGWALILEYTLGSSTVAVGWSGYVVSLLKNFDIILPPIYTSPYGQLVTLADGSTATALFNFPAFLVTFLVTVILVIGVKESAKFNLFIVVIKLAVILTFICVGVWYINPDNWVPFIPENTGESGKFGISGIVTGGALVFFAYIGFDAVSTASQEAKNPQRDMPIGILGSLFVCTILYIIVSLVLTGIVSYKNLSVPDPIAVGVNAIGLPWLAVMVKIGAILGLSSVVLVLFYAQTRIMFTMSKDGLVPKILSKTHKKFKTPHITTIIFGLVIGLAAALTPIGRLSELVSMGTLFAFIIVCLGVWRLRISQPKLKRAFTCPWVPFVPIGGIISSLYLMSGLPADTWKLFGIWMVIGLITYFTYSIRHSKLRD